MFTSYPASNRNIIGNERRTDYAICHATFDGLHEFYGSLLQIDRIHEMTNSYEKWFIFMLHSLILWIIDPINVSRLMEFWNRFENFRDNFFLQNF